MDDNSSSRKSGDCLELEALKQIYEQICAIRHSHAQIVAENSAKRAKIQQRLEVEKRKLEELEAEHEETGKKVKDLSVKSDEQTEVVTKFHREQQELEHQRYVLDDLEFQLFETDAHYDEQKELIQQQLITGQQMINDVNRVYSANTDSVVLQTTTSSETDCVNAELNCSSKLEFACDNRLEAEDDCVEEAYSSDSESGQTNTTVSSSALVSLPEELVQGNIEVRPSVEMQKEQPTKSVDKNTDETGTCAVQ